MRTIATAAAIIAMSVAIASFSGLPAGAATCTSASVTGSYGQFPIVAPSQQTEGTSLLTFDGSSRVSGHETDVGNDFFQKTTMRGEYKVEPDCGIRMIITYRNPNGTINRKTAFEGVIVNSGAKIDMIVVPLNGGSAGPTPYVLEAVQ